jgi:alkyl hydroperoxide reductase subunit AhpF
MIGLKKLAAVVVAAGLAGTAAAGDYAPRPGYKAVTVYETVYETVHETVYVDVVKSVPYEKTVTKYDHCGKPYHVTVTCYKDVTVQVPKKVAKQVARKVAVTKWVKVCDY